jgi:holin-like protein
MKIFLKRCQSLILSFLVIYICLLAGKYISSVLPFVFPGSIIGLIFLFLLLELKIIKLDWILPAGNLLMKHMAFLFIPAAVGMVAYLNEVYSSAIVILINVFVGICLIILVVGRLFQHYSETPQERKHRKQMYRRANRLKRLKRQHSKSAINKLTTKKEA